MHIIVHSVYDASKVYVIAVFGVLFAHFIENYYIVF